jgi:hypothetical protein
VIEITPLAEDQVSCLPADFRNGRQCYGCNARSHPAAAHKAHYGTGFQVFVKLNVDHSTISRLRARYAAEV